MASKKSNPDLPLHNQHGTKPGPLHESDSTQMGSSNSGLHLVRVSTLRLTGTITRIFSLPIQILTSHIQQLKV